jgi:1-acyl-sn-glycerol-3-phosphate acyltransferase
MSPSERGYSPGWRRFSTLILQPLLHILIKQKMQGRENLPREGGLILAPNHLSYADWGTVALFSYEAGRYPTFLIKSSVFNVKGIGPVLRKLGQLPVYRNRGDAALVLRDAERALRSGECVVVYPEGTASRDPEQWPMKARTGVARLALTTGAPVIPIAHWGAQDVLPYGSSRPHLWPRKTVRMVAGPPVDLSAFRDRPLNSVTLRDATAVVMAEVTALLAGLRDETPPAVPYDPAERGRAAQIGRAEPAASAADGGGEPAGSPAGPPAESRADGRDDTAAAGGPAAGGLGEGPTADGPAADRPAADRPAAHGPTADGPTADGPATEARPT